MMMGLMKGKRFVLAAGVCALAAVAALSGCDKKDAKADTGHASHATVVNFAVVGEGSAPVAVNGSGTVSAWQEAPVGAEVGGLTAVALLVDEGQSVTKGQALLKMNDVLLQAELKQAQASANQSQKAYSRAKELYDKGYLSAAALDQAEASQQVTAAALATAQTRLSQATIRAPIAGVISSRKAVLGQIIQPGAELFRIIRDGRIELNMEVVEGDLHLLKAGMPATVTSESTGSVAGSVRIVTPMVDPATRLGYARISVPWTSGLRPGMFATGRIDAGTQTVMTVPQNAVVYSGNTPGAYVVGTDNKAHMHKVVLGERLGKDVVIKDGLTPGDRVITTGAGFLNDGDTVKLTGAAQNGGEK